MAARRVRLSLVVGLLSTLGFAGTVFAWPNILEGRPGNLRPGGELGYYVWHAAPGPAPGGPGLTLVTTGPEGGGGHAFDGTVQTDGSFASVDLIRPERADGYVVRESDQRIRFHFRTFDGVDGLNFVLPEGSHLILDLQIDGQPAATEQIFMGRGAIHPVQNPVVLYR